MTDKPQHPQSFDEAARKLMDTAVAELRRRGMTDAEIEAALKKKGGKRNA